MNLIELAMLKKFIDEISGEQTTGDETTNNNSTEFGGLVDIYHWSDAAVNPVIGNSIDTREAGIVELSIGNTLVSSAYATGYATMDAIAVGVTVTGEWIPDSVNSIKAYIATVNQNHEITAITAWNDLTVQNGSGTNAGMIRYNFVVPEVQTGQVLLLQYDNESAAV